MIRRLLPLLVVALAGCSSSETPAPTPSPSGTGTGTPETPTESATGTETPAETPSAETPALKAPKLTQLMKMTGALHVVWTNVDETCDSVVGERKTATTDYKVAFTVPGEVDNKHDMGATGTETYTYRLRCKKGDAFSPYSNEKSGSPQ